MKTIKKTLIISFILVSTLKVVAQDVSQQVSMQLPNFEGLAKEYLPTKVEFPSIDGLVVNGNLYEIGKDKPVILLCHAASSNRIEYADIAPKLNELGYNCMAIDQRVGGELADKSNETSLRAKKDEFPTNYLDAQQDIEAAINYLTKKFNKKIIIWGSSYSSSLVLFESLQNENVIASISFSPADYFGNKKQSLKVIFPELKKPFFITSSKQEAIILSALIDANNLKENQIQFVPQSNGFHGSKALWTGQKGAEEYWIAVTEFLKQITNN
jgi:dienelactone hydrolase